MPRGRPRKNKKDVLLKSAELFGWALGGLEREIAQTRERLGSLTAQASKLRDRIGVSGRKIASSALPNDATGSSDVAPRKRRKMSKEARKRISEMMKKRWAERRKGRA